MFRPQSSCLAAALAAVLALPRTAVSVPDAPAPAPLDPAADYFPLTVGSEWTYATDLEGGEMIFEVPKMEKVDDQDHAVLTLSVVKTIDGVRRPAAIQREWFRRTDAGDLLCPRRAVGGQEIRLYPPQTHLKAGLAPGLTWTWEGTLEHGKTRTQYTVEAEETVKVPAGEFRALRLRVETTAEKGKGRATRWLARGVGMVKEEVELDLGAQGTLKAKVELKRHRIGPPQPGDPQG